MTIRSSSPIWALVRSPAVDLGLTAGQVRRIVSFVNRSPTFSARMREFEAAGGQLTYSDDGTNCFWITDKRIYISRERFLNSKPGANDADLETLTEVLAHEMSHFVTYYKEQLDLASAPSSDEAAVAGVRDEARAYAHEYLIQLEINKTAGDKVDWMKSGQLEAIEAHVAALGRDIAALDMHAAATTALLEWAANWTGPVETAGGYFQFYRNYWLEKEKKPTQDIDPHSVKIIADATGNISRVQYGCAGTMIATSLVHGEPDVRTA